MWYAIIIFILCLAITYVLAINLEKAFYKMGSKKPQKKTRTGYISRRQRMKEYNKKER
tara:strand:- start:590 stop:763 length:174 start_codon:yes stop_codon:yes gene_type:complete